MGLHGLEEHREELRRKEDNRDFSRNHFDENAPPDVTVRRGEEARKIADTPHLTGDPEWDEIELAETDPSRPTLEERGIA